MGGMGSPYKSFEELRDREIEGKDYRIRTEDQGGPVLVMAPHGGKIEPGTTEIAEAIAGQDYSFYSFEGLTMDRNLHIESHLFDEPQALKAVDKAEIVVTVHGQLNQEDEFVMVGVLMLPWARRSSINVKRIGDLMKSIMVSRSSGGILK
jgi:phage replication-related protein YjqB (UPF0714/DUF867 family)